MTKRVCSFSVCEATVLHTCLQPSGVLVEEIQVDQEQKASIRGYREIQSGCHWSPELKQREETLV